MNCLTFPGHQVRWFQILNVLSEMLVYTGLYEYFSCVENHLSEPSLMIYVKDSVYCEYFFLFRESFLTEAKLWMKLVSVRVVGLCQLKWIEQFLECAMKLVLKRVRLGSSTEAGRKLGWWAHNQHWKIPIFLLD